MLKVENLKRYYKTNDVEVRALDGVSFEVKKGDKILLMESKAVYEIEECGTLLLGLKPSNELTQTIMMNEVLENLKNQLKIYKKNFYTHFTVVSNNNFLYKLYFMQSVFHHR